MAGESTESISPEHLKDLLFRAVDLENDGQYEQALKLSQEVLQKAGSTEDYSDLTLSYLADHATLAARCQLKNNHLAEGLSLLIFALKHNARIHGIADGRSLYNISNLRQIFRSETNYSSLAWLKIF